MAAVVPIDRYEPTAKLRERMPEQLDRDHQEHAEQDEPQGSLRLRIPLMTTDMRRACGAGASWLPMP